ncbi:MAG: SMC-Scp complex subunit ScpB [Phycisphaerales bacterium]
MSASASHADSETENRQPEQAREMPDPTSESIPEPASEPESPPIDPATILVPIEAMLVSSDRPLKAQAIIDALAVHLERTVKVTAVDDAVGMLNKQYDQHGQAFRIEQVSGGYRLMTRPEHAGIVAAMHRSKATTRLSKPALETLAIIAYRQPITRAELESIRGVACGEVVRTLMDRRLVKITGRAEELGRPMLYGTTRQFLDLFGLSGIKDLPKPEELADQMQQGNA